MGLPGQHVVSGWSQGMVPPLDGACTGQLPRATLLPSVCTQLCPHVLISATFGHLTWQWVTQSIPLLSTENPSHLYPQTQLSATAYGIPRFQIHLQRVWDGADTGTPLLNKDTEAPRAR